MTARVLSAYCALLSVALVALGVWGLFDDVVLFVLPTNRLHAVALNVIPGAVGMGLVAAGRARWCAALLGGGATLIGLAGLLVPSASAWITAQLGHSQLSFITEVAAGLLGLALLVIVRSDAPQRLPSGSMRERTCLVTGATSGIGKHVALELARAGAHVIVAARSERKGRAVLDDIAREVRGASLDWIRCDFSVQEDIRALARAIDSRVERLDILVNNAGAIFGERSETDDGRERTFALNHLGYFLTTLELLPALRRAPGPRVVSVASDSHRVGHVDFDDLHWRARRYEGIAAYTSSKLANVAFTRELARRVAADGILAFAMCPGPVRSGFATDGAGLTRLAYSLFGWAMRTPAEGAATVLYLCASDAVRDASGEYFVRGRRRTPSREARDDAVAARLWDVSLTLTRVGE